MKATAGAGAALALVAALALWPVVAGSRSFLQLDLRYQNVPIWHVVQQALLSRESPFWIDGQYCGNPLLFHQEAPVFYPLTVPLLATGAPAQRLSDLFSLFHFWLAGFAAFLLVRDLEGDVWSSLFGGIAWMLSARMVQSAIWPNSLAVQSFLPLVILGMFRIGAGRRRSGIIIASASGGLALLAARPHVIVAAAPLLLVSGATAVVLSKRRWRAVGDLALAGLLGFFLGAPSVVPTAALLSETSRAGGLTRAERDLNPLTPAGDLDQVFLPSDGPRRWPEAAAYPGILVALLVLAGVVLAAKRDGSSRSAWFRAMLAGGVVGLLFAFGERGPLGFIAGLPLLRGFRIPARYLTSWSLGLAVGSALALSALLRRSRSPGVIAAICLVGIAADLGFHARNAAPTGPSVLDSQEPAILPFVRSAVARDAAGFPRRLWSLTTPPFLWLFDDADKLAIARRFEPLYGALGMRYGLEVVRGAGPSLLRWKLMFREFDARRAELAGAGVLVMHAPEPLPPPIGNPRRLAVERFTGLPRALLVPEAIVVPRSRSIAATLDHSFDPTRTAVLEDGAPRQADPRWRSGTPSVQLIDRGPGRARIAANLPGDGILVVFNTFQKGWRARVDGQPEEVVPADGAFQGIRMPRGAHVVELHYRPPGVREGLALAAVGVLGLVLVALKLPAAAERRA